MEKKCVLIYDDDIEILNVCKAILGYENYHVEGLAGCDNIISDIKKFNPQIIMMDLWIPKMGGETAVKMMQQNEKTKHIPVILFSAISNIEIVAEKINATAFLKKPFDITSFRKVIADNIL